MVSEEKDLQAKIAALSGQSNTGLHYLYESDFSLAGKINLHKQYGQDVKAYNLTPQGISRSR